MTAFHSNWTKPFFSRNNGASYFIEDFELLTTILSALEWRKRNGTIKMITDTVGAEYYSALGISHIWDLGVETSLDSIDNRIQSLPFWAAGKLYALQSMAAPCVMLDTDFIVWKPLSNDVQDSELTVIHREEINSEIYPPQSFFKMKDTFAFPPEWDWSVLPCNTAFLYVFGNEFKNYYTKTAIDFMRNLAESSNITVEMVFAEQRLLAICASAKGIKIKSLLDVQSLEQQDTFTHLWGLKSELHIDPQKRRAFCMNCIKRIAADFPAEIAMLEKIETLKLYINNLLERKDSYKREYPNSDSWSILP
jgi:hypothetical protein